MELKYLNTFRTIVETGSFTKAAKKLNYTQSAITFQISQLEKELSIKLFEKTGRNMTLTQAGKLFVPYVKEVFRSMDKLYSFEHDLSSYQGDLYIGAGETLLCFLLPPVLKEFQKAAPKARLHLRSMNCYDIRDELLEGTLDLGIFYEDIGGLSPNLVTRPLGDFPLTLIASPETKRCYPDFITPGQRIPVPFIINESTCVFRQIFEQYLNERAITLDYTVELWSIPTIKNLVKNNMGISFLPAFAAAEELAQETLTELPPPSPTQKFRPSAPTIKTSGSVRPCSCLWSCA